MDGASALKLQSHQAYDQVTTYQRSKNVAIVGDRMEQISPNKVDDHVQNLKRAIPNRKLTDRTIDRRVQRLVYDRSQNPTIDRTIDRRARRLIVRSIGGCHD